MSIRVPYGTEGKAKAVLMPDVRDRPLAQLLEDPKIRRVASLIADGTNDPAKASVAAFNSAI